MFSYDGDNECPWADYTVVLQMKNMSIIFAVKSVSAYFSLLICEEAFDEQKLCFSAFFWCLNFWDW